VFYDRVVVAGLTHLMPRCRVELGPKNALDSLSKLIKISQTTASGFDENEFPDGFRCIIELLFIRMKTGVTSEDIAFRALARDEIPTLIGIVKLVKYLLETYTYKGKPEIQLLEALDSALKWYETPASPSEIFMVVKPSCKSLHAFIVSLYNGKWDSTFREIAEGQSRRRIDGAYIAKHGKFHLHLHDDVELAYQKEKVQQENVVKFAAAELTAVPVEDISAEVKAPAEENYEDDESDAKSQVDAENKESKLKAARERRVQGALERCCALRSATH